MKRFLAFFLLLSAAMHGMQAQEQLILRSANLPVADTVWVFTPSDYTSTPAKAYPLVYLLHGWNGSYHQWNDITGCQALADRYGFILVCPDALTDSWYINSPAIAQSRYADFFFNDLVLHISKKYRTDPENVFITGLSMGGHGALYLFAQQPGLFRSAGSLSGVLDLAFCWKDYRIGDYLGIRNERKGADLLKAYSVTGNAGKIAATGKSIIFTCGNADPFYELNNRFRKQCDELGIPATYIISPGGHDYAYWRSAIGFHLDFFAKNLKPRR